MRPTTARRARIDAPASRGDDDAAGLVRAYRTKSSIDAQVEATGANLEDVFVAMAASPGWRAHGARWRRRPFANAPTTPSSHSVRSQCHRPTACPAGPVDRPALPLTHFNTVVHGIILRGAELGDLTPALLELTAFPVVAVTIAASRLRKRLG